ncbi:phosphate ABC transporter substrate-binding protein [Anaerolinea thermophila]|uniref:phosphate ABC transporter substrate-binding protein n=1 Tax=Anaerolinea thermophila TaxID=167964 RepID=UPI0002D450CC|nr:phosphate ABC transporter substrate-binding protein [Anaerolinea thermophila]
MWFFAVIILILFLSSCASRTVQGETLSTEPSYYIQNKGSDTIVNLALRWAEAYQQAHPEVRISVTGGGSGTGIAALIDGTVDIANASRAMKKEEIEAARAKGIEPVEHVIARDAIAVIVNPSNPVSQLTLEQISLIYQGKINNWREVGGEDRPIVRLSRETNSGTHVYFLEAVVRLGQKDNKALFSPDTLLLPSSEGIITEVRDNPNAIGYDGLGYVTPEVKVLAVAKTADDPYILPSVETVNSGAYPISRDLYMYTQKEVNAAVQAYLDWLLSPEAQKIVLELGFVPVRQ